jgi:hypothetical protein
MLYLYHWFYFSFPSQTIWLCFAGQWCTPDSASTFNLELLPAFSTSCCCCWQGAVLLLLGRRIMRGGRLGCPGPDYLLTSKLELWWMWLLVSATPPSGELLELPIFKIHLNEFELVGTDLMHLIWLSHKAWLCLPNHSHYVSLWTCGFLPFSWLCQNLIFHANSKYHFHLIRDLQTSNVSSLL